MVLLIHDHQQHSNDHYSGHYIKIVTATPSLLVQCMSHHTGSDDSVKKESMVENNSHHLSLGVVRGILT